MITSVKCLVSTAFVLMSIGSALASSVGLSDTTTNSGTIPYGTNTTLAVPGSYTYGDTFGAGVGGAATSTTNPAGFYDDFVFTIAGGSADSVTSTINLGNTLEIDGLQAALFTYTPGQAVPVAGSPLANGWSVPFNSGPASGTIAVISPTTLNAGSYVLEIAGTVSGSAGGSYSGTLNLAPVPLPAGLPLLFSGIAGLAMLGRRCGRTFSVST
jgi:hypothetical protein